MNLFKVRQAFLQPSSIAFCFTLQAMLCGAACGQDLEKDFEYLIEVEAKPMEGYLKYKDSKFGTFYKLTVHSSDLKTKEKVKYEDLFVCSKLGEKPALVGVRRYAALPKEMKKKRVATVIKLPEKSKEEEIIATSYAVPPLIVELFLNDNYAGSLYVPTDSFFTFKQGLNSQGFQSAAQAVSTANTSLVPIELLSQPLGRHEAMFYQPSLKK